MLHKVIHCTGQVFFSQCQASSAALERLGICYQIEFEKKKFGKSLVKVGKGLVKAGNITFFIYAGAN